MFPAIAPPFVRRLSICAFPFLGESGPLPNPRQFWRVPICLTLAQSSFWTLSSLWAHPALSHDFSVGFVLLALYRAFWVSGAILSPENIPFLPVSMPVAKDAAGSCAFSELSFLVLLPPQFTVSSLPLLAEVRPFF